MYSIVKKRNLSLFYFSFIFYIILVYW